MAPSHLQGLNIVQPSPPATPYLSDADLLSLPIPDLNAQLELWTNLNFQSDEPLVPIERAKNAELSKGKHVADDYDHYNDQDDEGRSRGGIAETTAHENVVTPTVLPPTGVAHNGHANPPGGVPAGTQMPMDISSILASFGIDPFMAPVMQQPANQAANANSIAHLLAMQATSFLPPQLNPQASVPAVQPAQPAPAQPAQQPQTQQQQQRQQSQTPAPAPKRPRTARMSVSSADTPVPESPESDDKTSMTPTEDKRRRNTAASARFRLKKKEREAALERKAKELEVRVGELEKECEALRRENGWLKGLVVGVTGAGAVQQPQGTGVVGAKRSREESEALAQDQSVSSV
ncbi:uncharacterized protein B0H18DRAFT_1025433 [Fomitopsis serialis]|uniref:uncharacterized protein n=1 Tax=Fomitopsis serialis TaxID=139415 RepID=UPI0020078B0C|nr:uncharacterized protein B0H18DRAFT_1025433 [Neoantrodia serialis]KAH9920160.1 hypothetical protein B0H18DRAFT_1025433 [Neoantrodia serialis]